MGGGDFLGTKHSRGGGGADDLNLEPEACLQTTGTTCLVSTGMQACSGGLSRTGTPACWIVTEYVAGRVPSSCAKTGIKGPALIPAFKAFFARTSFSESDIW